VISKMVFCLNGVVRAVWLSPIIVIASCGLNPEVEQARIAAIEQCKAGGGTPYVRYNYRLEKCASPREQERLERLELACVSAGGTVQYDSVSGIYKNCIGQPAVEVNVNNNNGFKPYCPPGSQGRVYGCN
jgi:hypothetical protein